MQAKGFTLLELLVVIAIIALLSGVTLVALGSARDRSSDADVKSSLGQIKAQAELFFPIYKRYRSASGNYYAGDCLTNATMFRELNLTGEARALSDNVGRIIDRAYKAGGSRGKECRITGAGDAYMIAIMLKGSNTYWCVDNSGTAKDIGSTLPATGVVSCQ